MLKELKENYISMKNDIEAVNKNRLKIKGTILKMRSTLEEMKSRLDEAKVRVSNLESTVKKKKKNPGWSNNKKT